VLPIERNHAAASACEPTRGCRARDAKVLKDPWVVLLKLSGFRLDEQRLPDGKAKAKVLRAIDRCNEALSLKSALRLVRLSPARHHAWKRAEKRCELDDQSRCPRSHPTQLTRAEVSTTKEMVTATEYRHMPLRALSLYATEPARSLPRQQPGPSLVGDARVAVCTPAASADISKICVRNCYTPVIKGEITELALQSRVCQTPSHAAAPPKPS
jgi:hypothetical protein